MGCSPGDSECSDDEKPAHPVTISNGFWMGQTPVTVAAWTRYRKATHGPMLETTDPLGQTNLNEAGPDDRPAVLGSWEQAVSYCQLAGMKLPTEAQWEYAARAGTQGRRYGDLNDIAWYGDNSGDKPIPSTDWSRAKGQDLDYQKRLISNGHGIHAVAQKQPNAWQLYDILGNVFEWTADWYNATYYQSSPEQDPAGAQSGGTKGKVLQGGSWGSIPGDVRVSFRSYGTPDGHYSGVGFRCVGGLRP